jgi:hypothetical protein
VANCRRTIFASRGNEEPAGKRDAKIRKLMATRLIFAKQTRMMDRTKKYSFSFGYMGQNGAGSRQATSR